RLPARPPGGPDDRSGDPVRPPSQPGRRGRDPGAHGAHRLVMAPLSYSAALALKSEDAFAPLVQGIVMPLLLLSGILLPMALAPDWLRFLSSINPLTHAVDAARALFNGDRGNPEIALGVRLT